MGMSWKQSLIAGVSFLLCSWTVLLIWSQITAGPGARQALLVIGSLAVPAALLVVLLVHLPPPTEEEKERIRQDLEYQRWVESWTPPPQVVYVQQTENTHQEHLAEQARMFYLNGRSTPPTDWYPR